MPAHPRQCTKKQPPDGNLFPARPHALKLSQGQKLGRNTTLWNDGWKPALQMLGETRLFASETAATECTCPVLLEEIRTGRAQRLNHKSLRALLTIAVQYQKRSYVCVTCRLNEANSKTSSGCNDTFMDEARNTRIILLRAAAWATR